MARPQPCFAEQFEGVGLICKLACTKCHKYYLEQRGTTFTQTFFFANTEGLSEKNALTKALLTFENSSLGTRTIF